MADQEVKASGVQELIDRLSQEGVVKGRRQAESLTSEAGKKAAEILEAAEQKAAEIVRHAQEEADRIQAAGQDALAIAARDSVRNLESQIHDGFRAKLQRLVVHTLENDEFLKKLILEITRTAAPEGDSGPIRIYVPSRVISDDELQRRLEAGEDVELTDFVRDLTGDTIRDGFSLATSDTEQEGLRVAVKDQDVEIELTADAITDLLAAHLLPRFRAVIRS